MLAFASCLHRIRHTGPPMEWRGGNMWPGKRKPHLAFSPSNARGLLCASNLGQLYSSTLRAATVPRVLPLLGPDQHGPRPRGVTEFPVMMRRFVFLWGKRHGLSAAGLFCDLMKALYSVLREEPPGPLLCAEERAAVLKAAGLSNPQVAAVNDMLVKGRSGLG